MTLHITHYLRKPRAGVYSIERLYEVVRAALPADCHARVWTCRLPSTGLWPRLRDAWAARKDQARDAAMSEYVALVTQLKALEIDLFVFSCEGVDEQGIMWDPVAHNAAFKAQLLSRASQSLLLIDKSKFQRSSEVKIGQLSQVTHVIQGCQPTRR